MGVFPFTSFFFFSGFRFFLLLGLVALLATAQLSAVEPSRSMRSTLACQMVRDRKNTHALRHHPRVSCTLSIPPADARRQTRRRRGSIGSTCVRSQAVPLHKCGNKTEAVPQCTHTLHQLIAQERLRQRMLALAPTHSVAITSHGRKKQKAPPMAQYRQDRFPQSLSVSSAWSPWP